MRIRLPAVNEDHVAFLQVVFFPIINELTRSGKNSEKQIRLKVGARTCMRSQCLKSPDLLKVEK